jgi:hypothetical protein
MLTYAALRTLHVDHNELRLLEPWIGQLTALSDLALNNNRLTYFFQFFLIFLSAVHRSVQAHRPL